MEVKKNALIITDGAEGTLKMAQGIVTALKGSKVTVKAASDFRGNDILPADAFFLGCEKPKPESFAYLTDLLKHINLAGRRCGVFSSGSEKAVKYLAGLVKDCDASLNPEYLVNNSGIDIHNWAQSIIKRPS